jgi:iron complex outermembrane receptor protein
MMNGISTKLALFSGISLLATTPLLAKNAAPDAPAVADRLSATETSDIVVTARRRNERLQDVPVSVTAFSAAGLARSNVQTVADLKTITPGFTFASEGGKDTMALTMRGIGNLPLGEGTPGVVMYVNNVALPVNGSNIPAYDVANVQVLKGPQGTLFGKNTLGGAVLISTQDPTYDFGGYVEGIYGRYNKREIQGAVNVPIIADKVALRVAGQIKRQDPRTKALDGGPGFDDAHQDSFRVSLLIEPTDTIRSLTIYDYTKANELAGGLNLIRQNFPFSVFFGPGLGPVLDAQVGGYLTKQRANEHGSFDGGINGGFAIRKSSSIINNTSIKFGDITLRNIAGYRKNFNNQQINTGAVGPLTLPVAPGVNVPFTLFFASAKADRKYFSDEFQVLGDLGPLNFILGAYYNKDQSNGPEGSQFTAFSVGGVPASPVTSHVKNLNRALFAQVGYKITNQITLNAGLRYSWDKVHACGGTIGTAYVDSAACEAVAATGAIDGVGDVDNKGKAPSWTIGVDYKRTPDWLLYVVSRRGYRGANVNTPLFESRFTTGGADAACIFGGGICPDLRPFQKTKKETVTDIEAGSKLAFRSGEMRGHVNIAAYYSKYKNALQFLNVTGIVPQNAPDTPTNTAFGANISDQSIYGVEFEGSISPFPSLTLSANAAVTKVKIDKVSLPTNLPAGVTFSAININKFTPTFSGTLGVSWTLPVRPLDGSVVFDADLFNTAAFGGQNGEKLPGYTLVNTQLMWRGIGGTGLDAGVFLRNAFNELYYASASVLLKSFPVSSAYRGEPRTWGLKARYTF